jgi:hypothetical protein
VAIGGRRLCSLRKGGWGGVVLGDDVETISSASARYWTVSYRELWTAHRDRNGLGRRSRRR